MGIRHDPLNQATVSINVQPVNDAPVARPKDYLVEQGETLQINDVEGVLSNDTDIDGSPPLPLNSLVITEINYNPPDPTQAELDFNPDFNNEDFEFIELENVGDETIDLGSVRFTEGIDFDFVNAPSTDLGPGETVLVVANLVAFQTRYPLASYPQASNVAGEFGSRSLDNHGERIVLEDSAGNTIQEFSYDDQAPWPTDPDGHGKTLEVLDVTRDYDDPENWGASDDWGGSPGEGTGTTVATDELMARLVDGPDHAASFELFEDGSFHYTPDPGWTDADRFTYKASDGEDESDVTIVEIQIIPPQGG